MRTPLLLLALIANTCLIAQTARDIDLEVRFIKPDTNEIIYVPTQYTLQFRVKNNGPDALKPGDILRFYTWNTDTGTRGAFKYILTSNYLPGESFTVNHNIPINKDLDAEFYGIGLSCLVYNLSADSIKVEFAPKVYNNRPDIVVKIRRNNISARPHAQYPDNGFFYPNPAADVLHLKQNCSHIGIYNTTGQKVLAMPKPAAILNISALPPGVYFMEGITEDGSTKKQDIFIKQ
jgi:hypothetical protein